MVNADGDIDIDHADVDPADETETERRQRLMLPAKERVRRQPKLGLASMVYYIMDLRMRGRDRHGDDAGETWLRVTPEDLERLEDIADTLEWLRIQRLLAKTGSSQNRGRSRR
jgi:hypothetical protein